MSQFHLESEVLHFLQSEEIGIATKIKFAFRKMKEFTLHTPSIRPLNDHSATEAVLEGSAAAGVLGFRVKLEGTREVQRAECGR